MISKLGFYGGVKTGVDAPDDFNYEGLDDFSPAPFNAGLGCLWKRRVIVCDPWFVRTVSDAAEVIHEMGHVFASRTPPNDKLTDETDFLGWEYALARKLKCVGAWLAGMKNYGVAGLPTTIGMGKGSFELGDLTRPERRDLLCERLALAEKLGLTKDGVPMSLASASGIANFVEPRVGWLGKGTATQG